ncbi:pyridine nucleotide-disulfide oxidoreductase [Pseudidiomarina salinarum]|uniref:Pyridine nucleotide-disulfide oxidoreductase n=1 Tax=Pseudidiomarina salinarum TaxID=435908 RepID=A0A094IWX0_9GAMM|nr:NAD(P)/FAD-dependent oxidoreductase [Pseudidiomarina salinarum]KFZ30304.1 pyridine nucleotide-disulfide oxidoreductase [Pseudidiomarina salinarum]RUO70005.1 NAD(P)/FAD-dependent oxidoreductase [Pseudidiomarina salinarum]
MADKSYDLIVIGTGTAGSVVASKCRKAGWSVAIVDHRPFGGTCALCGCDPKKTLREAAEVIDGCRRMAGKGIAGKLCVDWQALQRHKRSFTDPVPDSREQSYVRQGIATWRGKAQFCGANSLQVNDKVLDAGFIVIATGAEPRKLLIDGAGYLISSDDFLELSELPQRLLLVGGGYIGFEFAHIAARAGVEVTLINRSKRPLSAFDPDLVEQLVKRTRELGVTVHLGYEVKAVMKHSNGFTIKAESEKETLTIETDLPVHAAGRIPAVADLDLDAGNIDSEEGVLKLNGELRSISNPAVFAAGDAAGTSLPLTPVAAKEGHAVADNLLARDHRGVDYHGIPSVVFTLPSLARVGLQEAEARAQNRQFKIHHGLVPEWQTASRRNESCYGYKILIEETTERILGAHVIGPAAAETINLFSFAMVNGLGATALRSASFAYPTAASDIEAMLQ